jgi:hypothetical protein
MTAPAINNNLFAQVNSDGSMRNSFVDILQSTVEFTMFALLLCLSTCNSFSQCLNLSAAKISTFKLFFF